MAMNTENTVRLESFSCVIKRIIKSMIFENGHVEKRMNLCGVID